MFTYPDSFTVKKLDHLVLQEDNAWDEAMYHLDMADDAKAIFDTDQEFFHMEEAEEFLETVDQCSKDYFETLFDWEFEPERAWKI